MKSFTRWIAAKFIKDHEKVNDLKVRARYGAMEGWTSIVINTLLFVVKLVLGLSIRSIALIADAVHTLADCATSIVVIIGFKLAKKPSDKEHPFGHGRMESVAALVVSILLFIAGVELIEKSIYAIITPRSTAASTGIIVLICVTILIKELMSRFSYQLAEIIDSRALKADALHHRSDVITTILVVIALISAKFGYVYIDGIMGFIVAAVIFYSAYVVAKEAINPLLGQAPSKQKIKEIENLAMTQKGVLGVHDIIFHTYGRTSIVSLHIEVSDQQPPAQLHLLSEQVEDKILQEAQATAVVHIDPVNKNHPQYDKVDQAIKQIVEDDSRISSYHDLRIVGFDVTKCNAVFDIVLNQDTDQQETYDIINSVKEKFKISFPEFKAVIKAEPKYAYSS